MRWASVAPVWGLLMEKRREIFRRRGCAGSSDGVAACRATRPPRQAPTTSTSAVKSGSDVGQALSTASITFWRHSLMLWQKQTETVMIWLSREMVWKKFLKSGGETLGSPKPPITTRGRESGRGSARISSTALPASEKVSGKEGLVGLAAQAVKRKGIESTVITFNTTPTRWGMMGSFLIEVLKGGTSNLTQKKIKHEASKSPRATCAGGSIRGGTRYDDRHE